MNQKNKKNLSLCNFLCFQGFLGKKSGKKRRKKDNKVGKKKHQNSTTKIYHLQMKKRRKNYEIKMVKK
jgi:hypothetical protein